jgi:small subunit ribosomal protein S8
MSDPIADLLTRIRNSSKAKHEGVRIPFSKIKLALVEILKEEGYINNFKIANVTDKIKEIVIDLKYFEKKPAFRELKKISKPSRRVYLKSDEIVPIYSNMGIGIMSTSKGMMTSAKAKKLGIGGEFLCQIF